MRKTLPSLLVFLSLAILLRAQSEQDASTKALVLNHVTVIDATGSSAKPDMMVVITGNRINALGKEGTVRIPSGAQVIDATDKFLIPGLWDMHAHPFLTRQEFFPQFVLNLYLANGVTGLRDMFGPLEEERQWQKGIEVGTIRGPRMVLAGPLLDGPTSVVSGSTIVKNEAEARAAVVELKRRGADFVKVYERLPRGAYLAIADEAKKRSLDFVGHVPAKITAAEASDVGQKSIEHLTNIAVSCSSQEAELQKRWSAALLEPDSPISLRELTRTETSALETLDDQRCRALANRFAKNGTWHDPTLVVLRVVAFGNDKTLANDPRLRYMPREIRETWDPRRHELWRAFRDQDFVRAQKAFPKFLQIVGIMHTAGVKFLAGTDPPVPYCIPGFSIHDELALFVQAGLTPMEALQTATRNPAEFLGLLESLGTIERGKIADLVLLDGDPLRDIRNTQAIHAVVLNGKLLAKESLQNMLAEVALAASKN
jgi:hypothetical protein